MGYGYDDTFVKARQQRVTPFEQLLEEYDYAPPKRGQFMEGEILQVDADAVLVNVGLKRDAIVPREDLKQLSQAGYVNLKRGASVPVCILRVRSANGDLLASISKGLEYEDWKRAETLLAREEVVELEVTDLNRGGLVVQFGRLQGFVPNPHVPGYRRATSAAEIHGLKKAKVGRRILLKPIEVDRLSRRLVFSGRKALAEARRHRLSELKVGQIVQGRVTHLADFGAFVELGGIDGLIHISELAWQRVNHPFEVVAVGDEVKVQIQAVDSEAERISLSRKTLLPSPWAVVAELYHVGDLVTGTVTSVKPYGAFVELPQGIEGLIHVSEMDVEGPESPADMLRPGDSVPVRIVRIEPRRERIGLSLRQVTREEQVAWMMQRSAGAQATTSDSNHEAGERISPAAG